VTDKITVVIVPKKFYLQLSIVVFTTQGKGKLSELYLRIFIAHSLVGRYISIDNQWGINV